MASTFSQGYNLVFNISVPGYNLVFMAWTPGYNLDVAFKTEKATLEKSESDAMAWNIKLQRARRSLDQKLRAFQPAERHQPPLRGWIRALRDSLGLSSAQLGNRLGVRSQSVDDWEKSETSGGISLDTLRRVGRAMDCTLVYALVPNSSLDDMVRQRAESLAREAIAGVAHTMALEDQQVSGSLQQQVDDYIEDHISERDLWVGNG